jgi:hypothetical protein
MTLRVTRDDLAALLNEDLAREYQAPLKIPPRPKA